MEYTKATTTQMYSIAQDAWARTMQRNLNTGLQILPDVVHPTTRSGSASAVAAIPITDAGSLFIRSGASSLIGVEVAQLFASMDALRLGFTNDGNAAVKAIAADLLPDIRILSLLELTYADTFQ